MVQQRKESVMYTGLYSAVSGSMVQEKHLAALTNNLANATTVGFKGDTSVFYSVLQPIMAGPVQLSDTTEPSIQPINPLQLQHAEHHPHVTFQTDFSQGALRETGNRLDFALEGRGLFVVASPQGERYTRQGTFSLNAEGVLVTQNGLPVQGEQGPIHVSGNQFEVDATGRVLAAGRVVDRLKIVAVPPAGALEKVGDTLFRLVNPDTPMQEAAGVAVRQGNVELSNSQLVRLLGAVIQTSRAYEAYQRTVQIFDQTADRAVNDIASTR
jgi:flagellar basal-body rod protein FlgF